MDKNARKVRNQDVNPCIDESDASQKCLDASNYDKSMCSAYFQRYKNCRKYWHNIMLQRRRDGVRPDMPTAAERQEMLTAIGGKPYWESAGSHGHCEEQWAQASTFWWCHHIALARCILWCKAWPVTETRYKILCWGLLIIWHQLLQLEKVKELLKIFCFGLK